MKTESIPKLKLEQKRKNRLRRYIDTRKGQFARYRAARSLIGHNTQREAPDLEPGVSYSDEINLELFPQTGGNAGQGFNGGAAGSAFNAADVGLPDAGLFG